MWHAGMPPSTPCARPAAGAKVGVGCLLPQDGDPKRLLALVIPGYTLQASVFQLPCFVRASEVAQDKGL